MMLLILYNTCARHAHTVVSYMFHGIGEHMYGVSMLSPMVNIYHGFELLWY